MRALPPFPMDFYGVQTLLELFALSHVGLGGRTRRTLLRWSTLSVGDVSLPRLVQCGRCIDSPSTVVGGIICAAISSKLRWTPHQARGRDRRADRRSGHERQKKSHVCLGVAVRPGDAFRFIGEINLRLVWRWSDSSRSDFYATRWNRKG